MQYLSPELLFLDIANLPQARNIYLIHTIAYLMVVSSVKIICEQTVAHHFLQTDIERERSHIYGMLCLFERVEQRLSLN